MKESPSKEYFKIGEQLMPIAQIVIGKCMEAILNEIDEDNIPQNREVGRIQKRKDKK